MPKIDDILAKALKATQGRKLAWDRVGRDSFRTQIDKNFLSVSCDDDDFSFAIYDDEGNLLESNGGTWNDPQQQLYEVARRAALKVDDSLESLDRKLNELL